MTEQHKKIGRRSKRKGKNYERYVAELFRHMYPRAMRGIGQARAAGEVPDVKGTPWWVECKHRQHLNITEAYAQARDGLADFVHRGGNPREYTVPIVVARLDDRKRALRTDLVVLSLSDFLDMCAELLAARGQLAPGASPVLPAAPPSPPADPTR